MQASVDVWNGTEFEAVESTPSVDQAAQDAVKLADRGFYAQVRVFGTDSVLMRYRYGGAARCWTGSNDDWGVIGW